MWENDINTFSSIRLLKQVNTKYPALNILVGGSTFYAFQRGEKVPPAARKFRDTNSFYNRYNTAIMINAAGTLQLYHKSRLTPGVEIMPTLWGWNFMEKYAIDLGGIVGSLGTDPVRKVFTTIKTVGVGSTICYESIFGEFYSEFVRNGAELMFIITNDGWWGNTAGYRQHFAFAHLRAIETRRSIARSANTGISAFIDQKGDALQQTKYWEPAAIKGTLNASSFLTFYVKHGDYIARIASGCGILLLMGSLAIHIYKKRKSGI
jgi:apolipoprotein N-acyltransferase